MTFEERMAELGVDLSDLPRPLDYSNDQECAALEAGAGEGMTPTQYILHLTDIIDRMETRIVNLTGESDYLISEYVGCECCTYGADAETFDEEPCASCVNEEHFEWSVPEDWSVDE